MTRKEIIQELKHFFRIEELVCPDVFAAFGERAWQFFDKDFLICLLILRRDVVKREMYVNNYHVWKKGMPVTLS